MRLPLTRPKSWETSYDTHTPDESGTSCGSSAVMSRIMPAVTSYDDSSMPFVASGTTCGPDRIAPEMNDGSPWSESRSQASPSTLPPTTVFTSANARMRTAASVSNLMTDIASYPPSRVPANSTARNMARACAVPEAMLRSVSEMMDPSLMSAPPIHFRRCQLSRWDHPHPLRGSPRQRGRDR